jgi:hypothetical protein
MQKWEYMQVIHVRDPKTGDQYWADYKKNKSHPIIRLGQLGEEGWELAAAYPTSRGSKVTYLLKRPIE